MSREDLDRMTRLHIEIRREAQAAEHRGDLLWEFLERLAQELLILRAQAEGG